MFLFLFKSNKKNKIIFQALIYDLGLTLAEAEAYKFEINCFLFSIIDSNLSLIIFLLFGFIYGPFSLKRDRLWSKTVKIIERQNITPSPHIFY